MSGSHPQRAESPKDFGTDKRGVAARWIAELRLAGHDTERFAKKARDIEAAYMDKRSAAESDQKRMNIFWSNVQTLKPAIYATPPKAVVQRRYLDQDPVARAASTILQRAIQTNIDQTGWHDATDLAVLDYLVIGRGTCWARYEPHFADVGAEAVAQGEAGEAGVEAAPMDGVGNTDTMDAPVQIGMDSPEPTTEAATIADDGVQITNDAEGQVVTYEEVCWDYVNWQDFMHAPARTWPEVRWVARRVLMTRDELVERFGAKVGNDVPMTWRPEGVEEDDPAYQLFLRARVFDSSAAPASISRPTATARASFA